MVRLRGLVPFALAWSCSGQMAGKKIKEQHPEVAVATCTKDKGCEAVSTPLTMDAQWRWLHDGKSQSCIKDNKWTVHKNCGTTCTLEGINSKNYRNYGVHEVDHGKGIKLKYVNGHSIGSRLYMMDGQAQTYKMFKLLNREFSFEVDVSTLTCGLNGGLKFVEMDADGGLGVGGNTAGAKYGTGYCDATCPHDLKFIDGKCNNKDWHKTKAGPIGHFGSCCAEMDVWEANALSTAFTAHPCETAGPKMCEGGGLLNECGDTKETCKCCHDPANCPCCGRFQGVCDKDGCDYNNFRLGNMSFLGKGPRFALDAGKRMTVVTQFISSDKTDDGELVEIRRLYIQDGKVIENSVANNVDKKMDSITEAYCNKQKEAYENVNDFRKKGGLKAMGEALRRGMVLVLSLRDDEMTHMNWLDSLTPKSRRENVPGVKRGLCTLDDGAPSNLRKDNPDATVTFSNLRVGEIGSTYGKDVVVKTVTAAPSMPPLPPIPATGLVAMAPLPTVPPAAPVAPIVVSVAGPGSQQSSPLSPSTQPSSPLSPSTQPSTQPSLNPVPVPTPSPLPPLQLVTLPPPPLTPQQQQQQQQQEAQAQAQLQARQQQRLEEEARHILEKKLQRQREKREHEEAEKLQQAQQERLAREAEQLQEERRQRMRLQRQQGHMLGSTGSSITGGGGTSTGSSIAGGGGTSSSLLGGDASSSIAVGGASTAAVLGGGLSSSLQQGSLPAAQTQLQGSLQTQTQLQPQTTRVQSNAAGVAPGMVVPVCCSSAQGVDKCNSCWAGSALTKGFCATEANCSRCGGTWCPQGVIFAQAFEAQKGAVSASSYAVATFSALFAAASLTAVAVVVGIRVKRHQDAVIHRSLVPLTEPCTGA